MNFQTPKKKHATRTQRKKCLSPRFVVFSYAMLCHRNQIVCMIQFNWKFHDADTVQLEVSIEYINRPDQPTQNFAINPQAHCIVLTHTDIASDSQDILYLVSHSTRAIEALARLLVQSKHFTARPG